MMPINKKWQRNSLISAMRWLGTQAALTTPFYFEPFWDFLYSQGRWDRTIVDNTGNVRLWTALSFIDVQTLICKLKILSLSFCMYPRREKLNWILKTSEQFTKDSFQRQRWGREQAVISLLPFSHKSQPQTRSQAMEMRNILRPLSASLPLGGVGREGHSGEKMRCWLCFLSTEAHKANQSMCEGMDSIARKTGIGHLFGREKLSLTELPHICTTSDTIPLQPHSTYVFSPLYTALQAPFPLPQARGSFQFTKAHCHIRRFFLLISGVISICAALLETCGCLCGADRENVIFSPSHGQRSLSTAHLLELSCFRLFPLFPTVLAECIQHDTEQVYTWCFPRHISNFNTSHLLRPFPRCSQHLRNSHQDMKKIPLVLHADVWTFSCAVHKFS